jgi:peptide deformylase
MAIRPVRLYGDPVLRTPADPVVSFDARTRQLVDDLIDTMHDEGGIGMAAPQIGESARIFVYDIDGEIGHLINPRLTFPDDALQVGPEGCLSIPGLRYDTKRYLNVAADGMDMYGAPRRIVGTDLLARCIQHETDHLDGILFIDRLDDEFRAAALAEIAAAGWNSGQASSIELQPSVTSGSGR